MTGEKYTVSGTPEATVVGEYSVSLKLDKNYCWSDETLDDATVSWAITQKPIAVPLGGNYTSNNNEITVSNIDTSGKYYTINGTYKATAIGDYSFKISLIDKVNTKWADGTTDDKTISWSITNGTCGSNVGWQLYDNGKLVIKGEGAMSNYSSTSMPWYSKIDSITSIVVENGVTSIGNNAFYGCNKATSITVADSVTSISQSAFSGCSSLESITLPFVGSTKDGTSYTNFGYIFGTSKYSNNSTYVPASLKKVVITGGTTIADYAFYGCSNITSIKLPDSVTTIGSYAFRGCTGLTSIEIPESVTTIGDYAFYGCTGLTSIEIPKNVTTIGSAAFYNCTGLTSIEIPENVTSIGSSAFYGCTALTSIEIPENVTTINYNTFYNCTGLTSIEISENVTSIGSSAFYGCTALTSIEIPENVTTINYNAFYNCTGLTSIKLPSTLTTIDNSAFYGCTGLTSIIVESGNSKYHSSGNCLIETESKTLILGCKNSVIPSDGSVTTIGQYAFCGCTGLTSIEIPESVTAIDHYAFYGCTGLTSIEIPESVTTIGNSAFQGCTGLTSIKIPENVTNIGQYTFNGCTGLTSIEISESVTTISDYAFYGCTALTSIEIPESVTAIGYQAFYGCSNLTSVTFKATDGWWYSSSNTATSGTAITVSDASTAATYLRSTYSSRYWKRSVAEQSV